MQTLAWASQDNSRKATAEEKLREVENTVKAYAYARVVATWHGDRDDRGGLFFVLEGSERAIRDTLERLATGLVFAVYVRHDLNDAGYARGVTA